MIRLFAGYDKREADGFHVFVQSLLNTSKDYALIPMSGEQADGTNTFTYERFRIPKLSNWSGWSIFVDGSDMLLRSDIRELASFCTGKEAVKVVKHDYKTKHPRKYVGTGMECENHDYPRKNWSSVILWNCSHLAHLRAADQLAGSDGKYLHRFGWLKDEEIGELPVEWNWLVDEYGENKDAKLLHWTAGIPAFEHYRTAPMFAEWYSLARQKQ